MVGIIYTVAMICVALWVVGLVAHIGGGLIHILLVLAIIAIVTTCSQGVARFNVLLSACLPRA